MIWKTGRKCHVVRVVVIAICARDDVVALERIIWVTRCPLIIMTSLSMIGMDQECKDQKASRLLPRVALAKVVSSLKALTVSSGELTILQNPKPDAKRKKETTGFRAPSSSCRHFPTLLFLSTPPSFPPPAAIEST